MKIKIRCDETHLSHKTTYRLNAGNPALKVKSCLSLMDHIVHFQALNNTRTWSYIVILVRAKQNRGHGKCR